LIHFDDLNESGNYNFEKRNYDMMVAYGSSKLASVYTANEIERRYDSRRLHPICLHMGGINTDISQHVGSDFVDAIMSDPNLVKLLKSPEQGAATTVVAAVGKEWAHKEEKYQEDREEAKAGLDDRSAFGTGYVCHTYRPDEEKRRRRDSAHICLV
jgi:hypothetical protein